MNDRAWHVRPAVARLHVIIDSIGQQLWLSETAIMIVCALLIGIGAGLSTGVMVWAIDAVTGLADMARGWLTGVPGQAVAVFVPAVGGLCVGLLMQACRVEAQSLDVSDVIAAVGAREGALSLRDAIVKAIGSVVTIGSGGSAGRESPLIQLVAGIGVALGRLYRLDSRRTIALLATGAAAGMAATFGAPLAGIMFALEVILGEFSLRTFSPLVLAAVMASVVSRALLGPAPAFSTPFFASATIRDLGHDIGLGVLAGITAWLFLRIMQWAQSAFSESAFRPYMKPAVGGLIVGIVAAFWPQVLGTGFRTIGHVLAGQLALGALLGVLVAKVVATSFTLGSGGAGSFISPSLFIGAALGSVYAAIASTMGMLPGVASVSGSYALVGMGAVLAAVIRAPATAVLLMFEIAGDDRVLLPLALATVASTLTAHLLQGQSIYALQLQRRGLDMRPGHVANRIQATVGDAMTPIETLRTVTRSTTLDELDRLFKETAHHGFVVLDDEGRLCGVVTLADLEHAIARGKTRATVGDICTRDVLTVFPDEALEEALRRLAVLDVGRLPVVDRQDRRRVVGVLRRGDIIHAYSRALLEASPDAEEIARARLQAAVGAEVAEFVVGQQDFAVNKKLRDVGLPEDCVVVSIHRGGRVVVPRGNTQFMAGDRVIILKISTSVETLRAILHGGPGTRPGADGST